MKTSVSLIVGILSSRILAASPAPTAPFFPNCKEKPCYAEIEGFAGNATEFTGFCKDSVAVGQSQAGKYGVSQNQTSCGDVGQIDTIRQLCDCIANETPTIPEGSSASQNDDAADAPEEAPEQLELDPAMDRAVFKFPDCATNTCYTFLDARAETAAKLKSFCEKSAGQTAALEELMGTDEGDLVSGCALTPKEMLGGYNAAMIKPSCDCVATAQPSSQDQQPQQGQQPPPQAQEPTPVE
ncbi:hypothetical protein CDD82_1203 [Ophiocordyceps australis]|uniref:Extracellular membrane protein CFEM domain-containing protein n=1 Tax=Ophiocordyceps australis TaxID=1399860 RepID=A0A2C5YK72_9HYPO|nr:hypothetical protein CDD82_1203 [Ophiocordyceps australis]